VPAPSRIGDLKTRVLSALAFGPPILAAAWFGGLAFDAVIVLVAILGTREWVRLAEPDDRRGWPLAQAIAAVLIVVAVDFHFGAAAGFVTAALATPCLWLASRLRGCAHPWLLAATVPYIGIACLSLMWVRNDTGEDGRALFFFLLLVIWATDIGGYAAGRSIGGPKLAPRFSPKKTWAGLVGGMIAAAGVGYAVASVDSAALPGVAALAGAVLAVVGQMGDLFESYMKRRSDVKDSGSLIPGHGGLLDRIDGLIAAAPVFAVIHAVAGRGLGWW
jgi:phosphatidate cytidylyltransferase